MPLYQVQVQVQDCQSERRPDKRKDAASVSVSVSVSVKVKCQSCSRYGARPRARLLAHHASPEANPDPLASCSTVLRMQKLVQSLGGILRP